MIEKLLMKLRLRDEMSEAEVAALQGIVKETIEFSANDTIVRAGVPQNQSLLLLNGLVCRFKDLRNGERQISELHVPGDFVDLHSFTLKRLDHSLLALTSCSLAVVPHERLLALTLEHPHLARILWFSTNLDAAIHREWVLSLGRRSSRSRLAHFFCEMRVRLGIIGMATDEGYALPLTQSVVAECLGLTAVHVNRMLKELRDMGLVAFRSGKVTIIDFKGLQEEGEFDPGYLYLDRQPR